MLRLSEMRLYQVHCIALHRSGEDKGEAIHRRGIPLMYRQLLFSSCIAPLLSRISATKCEQKNFLLEAIGMRCMARISQIAG